MGLLGDCDFVIAQFEPEISDSQQQGNCASEALSPSAQSQPHISALSISTSSISDAVP